jgi:hypothetical protein
VHVPVFLNRQVLVNFSLMLTVVSSGTVMSDTNVARLQLGLIVADESGVLVDVEVCVGVLLGVRDGVAVALGRGEGVTVDVLVGVLLGVKVAV